MASRPSAPPTRSAWIGAPARAVTVVLLPAVLAAEAGGQKRFEVEAATVGEALRALPIQDLLFDEAGELRRLVNVYVDGVDARGADGLATRLAPAAEVRIVGAVAGG
jgi:molybdopterin synthase sulfur carrier subunit